MAKIVSINPSDGSKLGEVEVSTRDEILAKVKKAHAAKNVWKEMGTVNRTKLLQKVIDCLSDNKEQLANLASAEMGMPISLARADVDDSLHYFRWYLANAEKYLSPEVIYEDDNKFHTVVREPIGVSANITPWNFPVSNFVWSVGQTLVCGNTVIYKTSEEVPLSGKLIETIMERSGLPDGVFSEIYGDGETGKILVTNDIDLICFTGSTNVGKYLYKVAAKKFIKVFLELGGSAPGIIFEDADLDRISTTIFGNRFLYSGQVCDGLKRLIVQEKILPELLEKMKEKIRKTKVGNASDQNTEIGPLVSEKQLLILEDQVKDAVGKGAKIEIGGKRISDLKGFFYESTILTHIEDDMKVWKEEVFGPVLPVMTFKTERDAVSLANDTKYGLGGYIFTEDKKKAGRIAGLLETGMVGVNNAGYLEPTSPFGGYKESGIGREHGEFGFSELTQVKVIAEEK